jgi:Tripartite tricarboxylate transporter family receptor/Tripartite tricarboxylate transporter TctB family
VSADSFSSSRSPRPVWLQQDFIGGLAVIGVAAFAFWQGAGLPIGTLGGMGPGMLPRGLAVLLGLLGVLLIAYAVIERGGPALDRWSLRGPLFVLGAVVAFGAAVRPLGLIYMCDQIVNLAEQIRGGAIKAYGIATEQRSPALPDIPTTKEGGLPEYQVSAWNALFAPKGTPKEIVTQLNDTLSKGLDDGATRKRLLELGSVLPEGPARSPEALAELVKSEVARWTPILQAAGARGTQ